MEEQVRRRRRLYLGLFLGWVAAVIAFSVIPLPREWSALYENKFIRGDYLLHFLGFFLGFLLYRLNVREAVNQSVSLWPRALLIFILAIAFLSESVQLLIPSRTFNCYDVLANYSGIAFGLAVTIIFKKSSSGMWS
jgi:VanZ family protein